MPGQFTVASPGTSLSTGAAANVTSVTLPPGSYLVWGRVNFALATATATEARGGLSLTSATLPGQAGGGGLGPDPVEILPITFTALTDTLSLSAGPTLLTLSATTTLYLVAQATFSVGTVTAYGTLSVLSVLGAGFNMVAS